MSLEEKKTIKVNAKGSLGVLALGDLGLKLWRDARKKEEVDTESNPSFEQDSLKKEKKDGK